MGRRQFALPPEPLRLPSYLRRYRRMFWLQTAGGVIYNTVIVAGPIVLGKMLDAAAAIERNGYSPERMRTLTLYTIAFALVTIFFQYARYVKRWFLTQMANYVSNDIRAGLLEAVLGRPMEQVERESVGDLMARSVGDVNQIVETVRYTINETWDTWLLMLSYFVVLMVYDPWITLLCSIPIPIALYVAESARHRLYRYSQRARRAAAQVSSHLQRTLNGVGILRLFGREEMENTRLEQYASEQVRWAIRTSLFQTGIMPVYATLAALGVIGVITLGGRHVASGAWTLGRFTAYLAMFMAMATRTRVAANVLNRFHAAQASWDRIREKIEREPDEQHSARGQTVGGGLSLGAYDLTVRGLIFRFRGASGEALHGVSFEAPEGAFLAVTGPVGSGKSALGAALTGLYPYEGSIRVGGRELRNLAAEERPRLIAYAGQDAFLFSASICQNITLQRPDEDGIDEDRLTHALRVSALAEDLPLFPEGLETRVGERGVRVSGGQRQRISLARAIYAGSPILVLDDPFSAVDIGTEERMIGHLRREMGARTLIIFSHRLRAFVHADRILVLSGGRVVEQGAHAELMAMDGIYHRIYAAQDWLERETHG